MDEATLCERIALIQDGQIFTIDTPENIIAHYPEQLYAVRAGNMGNLLVALRQHEAVNSCNAFGEYHHITLHNGASFDQLLTALQTAFPEIEGSAISPTIEDCFIKYMN